MVNYYSTYARPPSPGNGELLLHIWYTSPWLWWTITLHMLDPPSSWQWWTIIPPMIYISLAMVNYYSTYDIYLPGYGELLLRLWYISHNGKLLLYLCMTPSPWVWWTITPPLIYLPLGMVNYYSTFNIPPPWLWWTFTLPMLDLPMAMVNYYSTYARPTSSWLWWIITLPMLDPPPPGYGELLLYLC